MELVDEKKIKSAKKRSEAAFGIVESLRSGSVVIAPIEQGYVLVADMYSEEGIKQVKFLKELGEDIYFPLLVADVDQIAPLCGPVTPEQRLIAMEFWPGPLVIQAPAIADSMLNLGSKFVPELLYFRCASNRILREVCELMGPLIYSPIILDNKIATNARMIGKALKEATAYLIVGTSFETNSAPTIISFSSKSPELVKVGAIEEAKIRKIIPNLQTI